MRKALCFGTAMLLVSLVVCVCVQSTPAQAADVLITDFSGWKSDTYGTGTPVTLTPSGGTVTIVADGAAGETWGGIYKDSKTLAAVGMKATLNVSAVSAASGSVQIGIMNSLGKIGNNRIQASIMYEGNQNTQSRIRWRIRAKDDTVSGASWTVLATGTFADLWASGYNLGTNVTVYFKRLKNVDASKNVTYSIMFGILGTPYNVIWDPDRHQDENHEADQLLSRAFRVCRQREQQHHGYDPECLPARLSRQP